MFSIAIAAGTQYYEFLASPLGSLAFVKFGAEVVVLCMLLFGHLSTATRLRRRRRIALAIVVVLPLAGLIALDESRYDADFDTAIHFPSQLKPVPPSWVPTRTVAEFFAGTDALEDAVDALIEDGEDG